MKMTGEHIDLGRRKRKRRSSGRSGHSEGREDSDILLYI